MVSTFPADFSTFLRSRAPCVYSDEAVSLLASFFSTCQRGKGLLDRVYEQVYQGKVRKRDEDLVRYHTQNWCSPQDAVGLILDLGIPRKRYKILLSFMSKQARKLYFRTGYDYGTPFPSFDRVLVAWEGMLKGNLTVLKTRDPVSGVCAVQWPFNQWLAYVMDQPALDQLEWEKGRVKLTFIVRGDGFPVAGSNWSHLNVTIRQWGKATRTVSHNFVVAIAYKDDKDTQILARCWKETIEVVFLASRVCLCVAPV